jgi:acyl-coenzyme A thioesterase PaaI-like protein
MAEPATDATGIEYFRAIPWCARLIDDPNFDIAPDRGQGQKIGSGHTSMHVDPFFTETIRYNDGLQDLICLNRRVRADEPDSKHEFIVLMRVGRGIMGQYPISHGGFLAAVLDEVCGRVLGMNRLDKGQGMKTAYLNVSYRKPVVVPGVILATARLVKTEGRKMFVSAAIKDASGDACTTAEALFVRSKGPTL